MAKTVYAVKLASAGRSGSRATKQLPTVAEVRAKMMQQMSSAVLATLNKEEDPPYSGRLDRRLVRI